MDLDVLRDRCAEYDDKLEKSISLNQTLLREVYTGRARSALRRLAAKMAAGSVILLAVIVSLAFFLSAHKSTPQFLWSAVVLDVFAIAALVAMNAQIALALRIDYDKPIAAIQKRIQLLRKFRVRYSQMIFLIMTLTWAPVFIVVLQAFFGMDAYLLYGSAWIVWTVAFGMAFMLGGIWFSIRFGRRFKGSAAGLQFVNDITGRDLKDANEFLEVLCEFEDKRRETGLGNGDRKC
jgi:MFS family permease